MTASSNIFQPSMQKFTEAGLMETRDDDKLWKIISKNINVPLIAIQCPELLPRLTNHPDEKGGPSFKIA